MNNHQKTKFIRYIENIKGRAQLLRNMTDSSATQPLIALDDIINQLDSVIEFIALEQTTAVCKHDGYKKCRKCGEEIDIWD